MYGWCSSFRLTSDLFFSKTSLTINHGPLLLVQCSILFGLLVLLSLVASAAAWAATGATPAAAGSTAAAATLNSGGDLQACAGKRFHRTRNLRAREILPIPVDS